MGAGGNDEEDDAAKQKIESGEGDGQTASGQGTNGALQGGSGEKSEQENAKDIYWRKLAERTVQSHCALIAEPDSEQKLKEILDKTALAKSLGTPGQEYVSILLDQKLSGEPITAPHIRSAPFNRKRIGKLLAAVLRSRAAHLGEADQEVLPLIDGDVLMFLDAGKPGVQNRMGGLNKALCGKLSKKTVTVAYSEESVSARKMRVRGVATIEQSEGLTLWTNGQFQVPDKKREFYQGSNRGNLLAWVKLPKWETCWKLSFGDKKNLYGKARVSVGGPSVDADDDDADEEEPADGTIIPMAIDASGHLYIPKTRNNDNLEPVAFWSMPVQFFKEVFSSYHCKGVYDLAAGEWNWSVFILHFFWALISIFTT